jgi:hypothetical protein
MNTKMKVFADEWLTGAHTGKRFNGKAAYAYAGYTPSISNPSANASKLLRHPEVQAYIKKQLEEHAMDATEVLLRFTDVARFDVGDVVRQNPNNQRLEIDPKAVIENKRFVKSFGLDSNGEYKIEFHDPMAALRDITRILGMVKDGLDIHTGGGSATLTVNFVDADGNGMRLEKVDNTSEEPEDFSEYSETPPSTPES